MSKGKIAAQVAHASLEAYKKSSSEDQIEWEAWGSKKVVLKIGSLREIVTLQKAASKAGIRYDEKKPEEKKPGEEKPAEKKPEEKGM